MRSLIGKAALTAATGTKQAFAASRKGEAEIRQKPGTNINPKENQGVGSIAFLHTKQEQCLTP